MNILNQLQWRSALTPWPRGVRAGEAKLFLYADDIFQLYAPTASSAPISLASFEEFKKISGYKINCCRSVVRPVSRSLPGSK